MATKKQVYTTGDLENAKEGIYTEESCCGLAGFVELDGKTQGEINAIPAAARYFESTGYVIATTAQQPQADKKLKKAGFKVLARFENPNHGGGYWVKLWGRKTEKPRKVVTDEYENGKGQQRDLYYDRWGYR